MAQYGFYFDSARCTGCKTCVLACKDRHDLGVDRAYRQVYDYEGGSWTAGADGSFTQNVFMYHLSMACNHCTDPACVTNCPAGAMQKDEETGIVWTDHEVCIACGTCDSVCPYGAPVLDSEAGYMTKCDMCKDRVAEGKAPICVESCPLFALEFGLVEELAAAHPEAVGAIAPMPADSPTGPCVLIRKAPAAKDAGDVDGFVGNEPEIV
ncbi:MAG: dimethylsulfoxide reductase subunit B [Eggerthellaceae bacterium]|nr:dimethylsulfoxide reductase subunit B [Eggerthellaceae bacterium]